jgi:hypothetical protein
VSGETLGTVELADGSTLMLTRRGHRYMLRRVRGRTTDDLLGLAGERDLHAVLRLLSDVHEKARGRLVPLDGGPR